MTVAELIAKLQEMDPDDPVMIDNNGWWRIVSAINLVWLSHETNNARRVVIE